MASPAEQRFRIRFETTANTQGAKAAADAMRQTAAATTQAAQSTQRAADSARAAATATASHTAAVNANTNATRAATTEAARFAQANQAAAGAAARAGTQPGAPRGAAPRSAGPAGRPGRGARPGGAAPASGGGRGGGGGGGADASDWGGAALEFARAFEDAQYGIGGVVNNIPGLVAMLGGGAGLAGVLSIAAVGAAQLIKHLGGIGDAVDAEKLKAKLAAVKDAANTAYASLGEGLRDRMVKAIEEASEAARNALAEAGEAIAKGREEATRRTEDAGAKQTAYDTAADYEGRLAGAPNEPEIAAHIETQKRREAERATLSQIDAEIERAKQDAQLAKGGIRTANEQAAKQQATIDSTGAAKEKVLAGLREQGVISDQEKALQDLDAAQGTRDAASYIVDATNLELHQLKQKNSTSRNPDYAGEAKLTLKLERLRSQLTVADEELAGRKAIAVAAEQDIAGGKYTFEKVDKSQLRPWQAEALGRAPGQLQTIDAAKAEAERLKKEAEERRKQNAAALEEADRRQKALRQQRDITVLDQTQGQMDAGELPTASPEDTGQALARLRETSGRNAMPMLPGALPPPLPDPPPPPNPPLDVTPQTSTVGQAMEQQASAVSSAMTAMADRTTQIAAGVVQAKQTIEARMAAIEQQLQALRTLPT